jgi:hypothetical protein
MSRDVYGSIQISHNPNAPHTSGSRQETKRMENNTNDSKEQQLSTTVISQT